MLILVGVTINVALNGGLFAKAEEATRLTQIEAEKEELLSAVVAAIGNDGKVVLQNIVAPTGWSGSGGTYTSPKGNVYTVDEYGKITEGQSGGTSGEVDDDLAYVKAELEGKMFMDVLNIEESIKQEWYIFKNTKIIMKDLIVEDNNVEYIILFFNGNEFYLKTDKGEDEDSIIIEVGRNIYCLDSNDYFVTMTDGTNVVITGLTEKGTTELAVSKKLIIPATIVGTNGITYNVTEIGEGAFRNTDIEQLEFESGSNLEKIRQCAFENCTNLSGNVIIPNGVSVIGDLAFSGCENITNIDIPSTVITIGMSVFRGCTSITEFTLPSSVENLAQHVFSVWTETQTIYIKGKTEEPANTDPYSGIGWERNWNNGCNANIVWDN